MALWIGKQIDGADGLFYASPETLAAKGAKINMNCEVTNIDFAKKIVSYQDSKGQNLTENYDKLVLATGSRPVLPPIPGMDLENVQFVKLYQHAEEVIKKLDNKDIKHVTVVGAVTLGLNWLKLFVA